MKQLSFASAEYASKKKVTRRERFLAEMNQLVPWTRLLTALEPYYPNGKRGRPPIGLERMLRLYFVQQWYALADEALEDALYDSQALREFVGIDLGREAVPDATTVLKFRRLLEAHDLTRRMLEEINAHLAEKGLLMRAGTIVDATILAAPSSTKNADGKRDPDMHQTKKGNDWHFGMKVHVGVDAASGLVHTLHTTPANTADVTEVHHLLHGEEREVFADAGYTGAQKRPELAQCKANWNIARRASVLKRLETGPLYDLYRALERIKASIRARVEHPFHVVKNLFRHQKVRYRGLAKNTVQLFALFALGNLQIAKRRLQEQSVCTTG